MNITKDQFKAAIKAIQTQMATNNEIAEAVGVISGQYAFFGNGDAAIDGLINLLEELTNDRFEWIKYWLYDLECGEKHRKGSVTEKNGKPIPLKTVDQLYNQLKKEWKENA